jgi:predicted metalloprotease with PDZ domain
MSMDSVWAAAEKYGLDTLGIPIRIDKNIAGLGGQTMPDRSVRLYRGAFTNEEQLARTLAHEFFHRGQILRNGYPRTPQEFESYEAEARAYEEAWWADQQP